MTAQFLTNELTNLVQEAKRKNSDLRHVCTLVSGVTRGGGVVEKVLTVWVDAW